MFYPFRDYAYRPPEMKDQPGSLPAPNASVIIGLVPEWIKYVRTMILTGTGGASNGNEIYMAGGLCTLHRKLDPTDRITYPILHDIEEVWIQQTVPECESEI